MNYYIWLTCCITSFVSITAIAVYANIWFNEQTQLEIDNTSDAIIAMSCNELRNYISAKDNPRNSREGFARGVYYYNDCHIDNGWLVDSGGYCESGGYNRYGPAFRGDDWDCWRDYYPRDKINKIIYFPADWYYIDENGNRINDPTYVLNIERERNFYGYQLGEYKGVVNGTLKLPKYGDIYFPEIESIIKHDGAGN